MAENRIPRPTRQANSCYVVRGAALPISDRIPCLETPRSSNSISCECDLAKVAHTRARPPGFSLLFFRLFDVHCPASFSWAGISILARMRQNAGQSGMDKRPGEICLFGPPGWASSRARVPFSIPLDSFCLMKTRRSAFNVSTAAGPIQPL